MESTRLSFATLDRVARALLPYQPESASVSLVDGGATVRVEHGSFEGGWLDVTPDELVGMLVDDDESMVDLVVQAHEERA